MVADNAAALAEAERLVKEDMEKRMEDLRQRLELETHKLDDCHNEIENYRRHFEETTQQVPTVEEVHLL
jgi:predicted ribosome quality control (RQC) complex YloA/Tae2 family protein